MTNEKNEPAVLCPVQRQAGPGAESEMAYVAADPKQPGAAWACIVDDPKYIKETAKEIAAWVRKGANVMRVDIDTARAMMMKWDRPAKRKTTASEQPSLI